MKRSLRLIGTHNGSFHADESLACFLLKNTAQFKDADIIRTRDPEELAKCDIIVDVGGIYDPSKNRFDHHQREFQDTMSIENGKWKYETRLSSAGLIYRHFGHEAIGNIIAQRDPVRAKDVECIKLLYRKLYEDFVEAFDGIDNGVDRYPNDIKPKYRDSTGLAARVSRLLPWWNEDADDYDERFKKAVDLVGVEFVERLNFLAFSWLPARDIVHAAIEARFSVDKSGRVIKLAQSLPWKEHLFELETEHSLTDKNKKTILYVLFPEDSKNASSKWRIQCVPKSLGGFENRKSLPDSWRGLRDEKLSDLSAIPGCIFVHASGFIGGNLTYQGVQEMAAKSINE